MEREVSKVIPIAERITDFRNENAGKVLTIIEEEDSFEYYEEYIIVHYRCNENATPHMEGGFYLNSFIESITVSKLCPKNSLHTEEIDDEIMVYYTDNTGINYSIIQYDICEFLIEEPRIVVSPEGMLIFFTEDQIIATIDCNHYHWIDGHVIDVEGKFIKDIEVCEDYTKVILVNSRGVEYNFSLKFDFDMTSRQMFYPKVSQLQ